ncbi:MAG TPA: PQQ-binding-like beta-propeller repeat protein [Planctomycetota bacterium]|nr:PQQ-binding-like beta-propeller repeat protein [Planctomycetota bacterium]
MTAALLSLLAMTAGDPPTVNWPSFRGPEARGVAVASTPLTWNADSQIGPDQNILWKTPIPGLSHSSPIAWENLVFVATAVRSDGVAPLKVGLYGSGDSADDDTEQRWILYALDKKTGKVLWERTACQGAPRARRHPKATHANTTLATDGKHLVACFGSEGLYAYDLKGELLWKKDLGVLDSGPEHTTLQWGYASSPRLFKDRLIVQADQKKGSFLAAYAVDGGKELWRTSRDGVCTASWATPCVVETPGRTQVVCNGFPFIASYDAATGRELWRLKSAGDLPTPTPIFAAGLIFVTNAHGGGAPLYAIRPEAEGDISLPEGQTSNAGVAWSEPKNGAYLQTPIVVDDLLYSCSDHGVLKAYDAATGKLHYAQRLGTGPVGGLTASPIAAGGKIYFSSELGQVFVVKPGSRFELLATNHFGEILMASGAISENILYFHTRGHMVAVAE